MKRAISLLVVLFILLPGPALAEMLSVGVKRCNFRQSPSTSAPILFTADRYYPVKVLSRKGDWIRVQDFEGDTAWVFSRLLSKIKAVVVKTDKANVRQKATTASKVIFTAAKGAAFKVLKEQGSWLMLQHADGDRGWMHKSLTWGD